jgi:hypothetical protein
MAIDTAAKRSAALQAGLTPGGVLPTPDGSIDAADRAQLAGVYAVDAEGQITGAAITGICLQHPSTEQRYLFDWTDSVPDGVSITEVEFTVPSPLVEFGEEADLDNDRAVIGIRGVKHGGMYLVLGVATLSDARRLTQSLTLRGFNG